METTATYHPETDTFEIHTPTDSAQKFIIGNGARADHAIVWAQFWVRGTCHGPHAFIARIRGADGRVAAHVRVADHGMKVGLNGMPNGRLWFDRLRVPRAALLNYFGDVDAAGEYSSTIPDAGLRFLQSLSELVSGRVWLAAGGANVCKLAVTSAIRYSMHRTQFGDTLGAPERPLFSYKLHRRRLLPLLANAYANHVVGAHICHMWATRSFEPGQLGIDMKESHIWSSGLKAMLSWTTLNTIQECREACGGMGYLAANHLGRLRTDAEAWATFEGDNYVLLEQVAKQLVQEFASGTKKGAFPARIAYFNQPDVPAAATGAALRSPEALLHVYERRERLSVVSLARRVSTRADRGAAWVAAGPQSAAVGMAHAGRLVLSTFVTAVRAAPAELQPVLGLVLALYGVHAVATDASFVVSGAVEAGTVRDADAQLDLLLDEVAPFAGALVEAFTVPDHLMGPMAQPDYGAAFAYARAQTNSYADGRALL